MYVTEISLSDFLKLKKKGYRMTRVKSGENRVKIEPVEFPIISDEDVEYSRSMEHKDIAVFYNDPANYENLRDCLVVDKFYVPNSSNYCVWCGVEHVYSEKGRWAIKADSECGYLSKRLFDKLYIIHTEE